MPNKLGPRHTQSLETELNFIKRLYGTNAKLAFARVLFTNFPVHWAHIWVCDTQYGNAYHSMDDDVDDDDDSIKLDNGLVRARWPKSEIFSLFVQIAVAPSAPHLT